MIWWKQLRFLSKTLICLATVALLGFVWFFINSGHKILLVAILGITGLLFAFLLAIFQNLRMHIDLLEKQVLAVLSSVTLAHYAPSSPTFFLRHAVSPDFVELVFEVIRRKQIKRVLELGCGTSTLYFYRVLPPAHNGGLIICLEDSLSWVELIQAEMSKLTNNDSPDFKILHIPLVNIESDLKFYDLSNLDIKQWLPFDLLIVDGPSNVRYRLSVKNALGGVLSPNGVVIFDDGDNPEIKKAVRDWVNHDDTWHVKYYPSVKGTWILWKDSQSTELPLP